MLHERHPDLDEHSSAVGRLAELVARRLRLDERESARVRLAADLHDIGKAQAAGVGGPGGAATTPGRGWPVSSAAAGSGGSTPAIA